MSVIEAPSVEDDLKVIEEFFNIVQEENAQLLEKALDHVNDIRKRLDLDPLDKLEPGLIGSPRSCPIARSIVIGSGKRYLQSAVTYCTRVYDGFGEKLFDIEHTDDINKFIGDFDDGTYPFLELEDKD